MDERSSVRRAAVDALAGALAGGVARIVVAPLDVVKIRFQVQLEPTSTQLLSRVPHGVSKYTGILQAMREILQEEGLRGLWRGNVPALLLVMPYTAIQFVVLQAVASHVAKGGQFSPVMSYVGGSLAGCAATIGSYPFDLLRTVLASQGEPKVYSNMRSAFWKIYRSRGIGGLYSGLVPSLVEMVPYAGLQFGSYDTFKRWAIVLNQQKATADESAAQELSAFQNFICGLGAGTVAKTFCHPLDVVKKRYQIDGLARHHRYGATLEKQAYRSVWHAIKTILESEGWAGLYKGLFPSIIKAGPAAAVTFVVYEKTSKWLQHM